MQYLRILWSSFGEEDFQRFASNFLCSNCLWLLFRQIEAPSAAGFREEVKNVKIWFLGHNFMAQVGGATNT